MFELFEFELIGKIRKTLLGWSIKLPFSWHTHTHILYFGLEWSGFLSCCESLVNFHDIWTSQRLTLKHGTFRSRAWTWTLVALAAEGMQGVSRNEGPAFPWVFQQQIELSPWASDVCRHLEKELILRYFPIHHAGKWGWKMGFSVPMISLSGWRWRWWFWRWGSTIIYDIMIWW